MIMIFLKLSWNSSIQIYEGFFEILQIPSSIRRSSWTAAL